MSNKTSFNVRIDEDLKNQASMFFNSMGLTLTSAINLFIKQALIQGELPFIPIAQKKQPEMPERLVVKSKEDLIKKLEEGEKDIRERKSIFA